MKKMMPMNCERINNKKMGNDLNSIWDERHPSNLFDSETTSEVRKTGSTIAHEPPFDDPCTNDLEDLMNFGFGGYGNELTADVNRIEDVRMLVNYYSFLITEHCKQMYKRVERNHEAALWRGSHKLLSVVAGSKLCGNIPVHIGNSRLASTAERVASILIDNSIDFGSNSLNYERVRDEINALVEELRFYFYAYIDFDQK